MDKSTKKRVSREVARSFPEMKGVRPSVKRQGKGDREQYLLVYKGKTELPGGREMTRFVRVVIDDMGNILRMSTSR
jgi:hypothetical protein